MRIRSAMVGALLVLALHAASGVGLAWGVYSITVSASPCALYVNGRTSTVTAHVQRGLNPVPDHEIRFTIQSGPGSVSPSADDTNASGNASTQYTSSAQMGQVTIRATDLDEPGDPYDECTIVVFYVSDSDDPIWYFNGLLSVTNCDVQSTLTAWGSNTGNFTWEVINGSDKAGIVVGDQLKQSWTFTNDPDAVIRSKAPSAQPNDVTVRFRYNGSIVKAWTKTVRAPSYLAPHDYDDDNYDDSSWGDGWWTDARYKIYDQLNSVLPKTIDMNEQWVDPPETSDWYEAHGVQDTWAQNSVSPWYGADPESFIDSMWFDLPNMTPEPQNPQDPPGTEGVDHWGQRFRAGTINTGQGRPVRTHNLQRYRDHGRHGE